MDRTESAGSKEKRGAGVGEAHPFV